MKRYNQGFGKFGPMERADNDGEWVRYEDACRLTEAWSECCDNLYGDNVRLRTSVVDWQILAYGFAFIDFILLGFLVFVK